MTYSAFRFELGADGVAVVHLDVPGSNANVIGDLLIADLDRLVQQVKAEDAIKGVVITSAKSDFMAGGDLKAMVKLLFAPLTAEDAYRIATMFQPTLRRIETCGKPWVAAINGPAMGGGLELALACHYRLAVNSPKVQLGLPEITLSLMPGAGGTQRLPRLIGIAKALPLLLKGTRLDPSQALDLGVVHALAEPGEIVTSAKDWILHHADPVQPWDKKGFAVPGGGGFSTAELGQMYNMTATQISRDTLHNMPAPMAILNAVARGTAVPLDAALHIEACEFAKLVLNPVARNMVRTLFLHKGELDKLARRPKDVVPMEHQRIGIIGAGLMGTGLAHSAALAGLDAVLIDATLERAQAAKANLAAEFSKRVAKGRMKQDKADALLARIHPAGDYAALANCSLVIEAVFEDQALKKEVLGKAAKAVRPGTVLASNTSTLPITELAGGLEQPDRFIGLHFFSPVDRMPLVEVVTGKATSQATLAEALDLCKTLRKTPIVVNDSRGFFTTRVIGAYIQEAFAMVGEGVPPALVDNAAKLAGYPVGPLAMLDEVGMDNGYKAALAERDAVGAERWKPGAGFAVNEQMVTQLERRGRRFGAGFYDYENDKRKPSAALARAFPPPAELPPVEELKQRMLFVEALEAARALEEGVITDPAEGDVGAVLGIGFPGYTGGPFSLIDTVGLDAFIVACDKLAARHGERFRPSDWLRERARRNQPFHAA